MNRPNQRLGVTVVELMLVISVLCILLGLLLPAVQAARESARRLHCQNQVRQMALASLSFESAQRFLPSNGWGYSWIGDSSRGYGRRQPGGWIFHLAPHLEIVLPGVDAQSGGDGLVDRTRLTAFYVSLFRCPSRDAPAVGPMNPAAAPWNANFLTSVAKTDYAICEGDYRTHTGKGPSSLEEGDSPDYSWTDVRRATGVSFLRSEIGMGDITDGATNTYLIGEKNVCKFEYASNKDLGYDQSMFSGVDLDLNRWTDTPPAPDSETFEFRRFGSAHPGYFVMSFCDGSVKVLDYTIDPAVHRRFGNRKDGSHVER